jgi:hypothetical protein
MFVSLYQVPIFASIIYEDNSVSLREALWSNIISQSDGWESTPWILIGDFSAIQNQSDSLGTPLWAGHMRSGV